MGRCTMRWFAIELLESETPLSEKQKLDTELTLSTAVTKVHQAEEVKKETACAGRHLPSQLKEERSLRSL